MANTPDSFEHLLDQFLFRACTKYGYCIPKNERDRLVYDVMWEDEAKFVEQLMISEGLSPSEQPKHHSQMVSDLRQMIDEFRK